MKKKIILGCVALIFLVLLIPIPMRLKNGGYLVSGKESEAAAGRGAGIERRARK